MINETVEMDNFIIHIKEDEKEIRVFIHRKDIEGVEVLPSGYILGHNAAIYSLAD